MAETEERTTPDVVTGLFVYYRFRKPNYTADERRSMVDSHRRTSSAGRDVFAYFKHEETPEGRFLRIELLREAGTALEIASLVIMPWHLSFSLFFSVR